MLLLDKWDSRGFLPKELADQAPPTPPLPDSWTENFIERLTGKGEPLEWSAVRDFLCFDGYRAIQALVRFGDIESAIRLIEVYRLACDANKFPWHWEVRMIAIKTYFSVGQEDKAKEYLRRWWQSTENRAPMATEILTLVNMPDVLQALLSGVLQDIIEITEADAINFLLALNSRSYTSPEPFIPSSADWQNFFENWKGLEADDLTIETKKGVTEQEILLLESRIGMSLPPSYKTFLLYTNGCSIPCYQLLNVNEVEWYEYPYPEVKDRLDDFEEDDISDEEYFQYGEHQDCISARFGYFRTALRISDEEDGFVFLLNPRVVDEREEWEAMDVGSKYPGAYRFRSFWELMQDIHRQQFSLWKVYLDLALAIENNRNSCT